MQHAKRKTPSASPAAFGDVAYMGCRLSGRQSTAVAEWQPLCSGAPNLQ